MSRILDYYHHTFLTLFITYKSFTYKSFTCKFFTCNSFCIQIDYKQKLFTLTGGGFGCTRSCSRSSSLSPPKLMAVKQVFKGSSRRKMPSNDGCKVWSFRQRLSLRSAMYSANPRKRIIKKIRKELVVSSVIGMCCVTCQPMASENKWANILPTLSSLYGSSRWMVSYVS